MLLIPKRHGQTDRQTDGRLTVALPRSALASRGNKNDHTVTVQCFFVTACVDIGLTVSERYSVDLHQHLPHSSTPVTRTMSVGYIAHLMGAVAGLTAGFLVLGQSSAVLPPTADSYEGHLNWRRRRWMDVTWSAVLNVRLP